MELEDVVTAARRDCIRRSAMKWLMEFYASGWVRCQIVKVSEDPHDLAQTHAA